MERVFLLRQVTSAFEQYHFLFKRFFIYVQKKKNSIPIAIKLIVRKPNATRYTEIYANLIG